MTLKNGNQERVAAALAEGHKSYAEIQKATGLNYNQIANAMRRLRDRKLVEGNKRSVKTVSGRCELADIWK